VNLKEIMEINPNREVKVSQVGHGKFKVVVIDNFYKHPERVRELALGLEYTDDPSLLANYPGTRALITLPVDPIHQALADAWGEPLTPYSSFSPITFSIMEQAPDTILNWGQRQPHIDPGVTALAYLNHDENCHGGTALYRHRISGLERVPTKVTEDLLQLAIKNGIHPQKVQDGGIQAFTDHYILNPMFALRENRYPNDGTEFWEMICLVKARFNRMAMFDGRMPHSMHLELDKYHDGPRLSQILHFHSED